MPDVNDEIKANEIRLNELELRVDELEQRKMSGLIEQINATENYKGAVLGAVNVQEDLKLCRHNMEKELRKIEVEIEELTTRFEKLKAYVGKNI